MASLTLLLLCSPYAAFAATTSGSFSLLSYNVAGLPELLSSGDPAVNTPLISPRLTAFNVINVQEDFNYHAALYADDDHPFRTPTSGGALIGSGLNSLSDYSYVDFERHGWDDCNLNSGDCLTPKGFTYMRVRASEGMFFDLYNLHTDAGSDDADRSARAANLAQLVAHIGKWSAGVPVVIMGDTNARYSNNVDGASLRNLISSTGVTDAWVSNVRGAPAAGTDALVCPFPFASGASQATMVSCEVVDKIFVRSGRSAELRTTAYTNENDAFVNASGAPLSDHYPISADASWKLSSSLRMADSIGGPHGDPFNDLSASLASTVPKITSFTIRAGERVDGLSYALSSSATVAHGGSGGTARTLSLSNGQYINSITICSGQKDDRTRVFYIKVTTNTGSTLEGGSTTGSCISQSVPSDPGSGGAWGLVGFWGRSGNEVDRLAPIWGSVY